MKGHQRYIWIIAVACLLPLPVLWLNWLLLADYGEWKSLQQVVQEQRRGPQEVLYGTGLHDDEFAYKMALLEAVRPRVVVIGSSRAMMFERRFFSHSFVNAGRAMSSIHAGYPIADRLLALTPPPQLVIIVADFWWFNARHRLPLPMGTAPPPEPRLTLAKWLKPVTWLKQRKISLSEWLRWPWWSEGRREPSPHIGIRAIQQGNGFLPDGSGLYTALAVGDLPSTDPRFSATLADIAQRRHGVFQASRHADPLYLDRFAALVKKMESAGMAVVVTLAPVAPAVKKEVERQGQDFAYMAEIAPQLAERGVRVHDYLTHERELAGDCEYLDGFHGGRVLYARLLHDMLQADPQRLAPHVDAPFLQTVIAEQAGRTQSENPFMRGRPEVDFLQLGCDKSPPQAAAP
ncbi:MAG: hypothetical protein HQL88_00580 [Magnetococcales bacterium]|nr:hypothetical protein [Magnetococcales bacterium]